MKFKVGDRVRIVKPMLETQQDLKGSTFVIKYVSDSSYAGGYFDEEDRIWKEHELELVEVNMTKKDLKDGDIVTLRNGDRLVLFEEDFTDVSKDSANMLLVLDDLDNNLNYARYGNRNEDYDVIKVERPVEYETVFERKEEEVKELTVDEISEKLGYKVKVVGLK
jgi:hypothetical protein